MESEEDDYRKWKNPFADDDSSEETFQGLRETFAALVEDPITPELTTESGSSGSATARTAQNSGHAAAPKNLKAQELLQTRTALRASQQLDPSDERTVANIRTAREKYEKAFPETFSLEIQENSEKLKILNERLQKEIDSCRKKSNAISPERANDIYSLFLLSDIIRTCTPCKIDLSAADLEKIVKFVKKDITELRLEFGSPKNSTPRDVDMQSSRKIKTARLYRVVSELVRGMTDINIAIRVQVKERVELELKTLLKFTDNDLGTGFFRNTGSEGVKFVIKEIKWHLEPDSIQVTDCIVSSFKKDFKKADKSKEERSMAVQFASKDNEKLFKLMANTIDDVTAVLKKQVWPKEIKRILKDIFVVIDNAARVNISDAKKATEYAQELKRQVIPFVYLNGYGGTITGRLATSLTGNELKCATYVWQALMRCINSAGKKNGPDKKEENVPKAIVKAAENASAELARLMDALFKDIHANDPDKRR